MAIDTIKSTAVLDGAIATADIADDAVTSAKLGSGAVDTTALGTDAVTTAKIAASQVTNAKIANSTLDLTAKVTGTLPVANGGTALTSGFLNGGITFGAATDVSGSVSTTFTGIPSTHKMIRVLWFGLTPGSQYPEWRLGDSSSFVTTGYFNHMSYTNHNSSTYVDYANNANSFRMPGWTNSNNTWYGYQDFHRQLHTNGNTYYHQETSLWNSGFTTYGTFFVKGFVNVGTKVIDRYTIIGASSANITSGNFQVGYI